MSFDMAAELRKRLGTVSDPDTGREQITYIDLELLDADAGNFYEMSGLPELASNIQLCGLQQPIRVRAEAGGRYTIVSGHRRRAALEMLVGEGQERFRSVPCIVETQNGSEAMRELRLIFANSATRRLTDAELSRQAERVEELLYRLAEEGVEFPGRMRDQVAAACKVSATKLAELKVIREKLAQPFQRQFGEGKLNASAAYKLARLPADIQQDVAKAVGEKRIISGVAADNLLKTAQKVYDFALEAKCPARNGDICTNAEGFLKATALSQYSWQYCEGRCCCECSRADRCSGACKAARNQEDARRAEREAEREKDKERREREQQKLRSANAKLAKRLLRMADAMGLAETDKVGSGYGNRTVSALRKIADGTTDEYFYSSSAVLPGDVDKLKLLAQQMNCTTDYLIGLSDEPQPAAQPEGQMVISGWMPGGTNPGHSCLCACMMDLGGGKLLPKVLAWDAPSGRWLFKPGGAAAELEPAAWMALPEYKGGSL